MAHSSLKINSNHFSFSVAKLFYCKRGTDLRHRFFEGGERDRVESQIKLGVNLSHFWYIRVNLLSARHFIRAQITGKEGATV